MNIIQKIRKRDSRIVPFEPDKIRIVISKAFMAVGRDDKDESKNLSYQVIESLEKIFHDKIPNVEDVQDLVEETLMKNGYGDVAKGYILYREKRSEIRETKKLLGVEDDLKLPLNSVSVLERRYLLKDSLGRIIETPRQMFQRVAKAVAQADLIYNKQANVIETETEFYKMMTNLEFIPNSPTLMNAGTIMGQLSACFVLPVDDSIVSIFDTLKHMALIHQSGGGTGFSFSNLRQKGDMVGSTKGIASGPVSFMRIFDTATDVVKQGGRRRGANMGILRINHPDIIEFITSKSKDGVFQNFNLSVAITDDFMKAVKDDVEYDLINPRTKEPINRIRARNVFDLIVTMAWSSGDPGAIFIDEINQHNPTPLLGSIESTNPCGEQPLLPYESCVLGSINLAKIIENRKISWEKLKKIVHIAVHFLDNIIDINKFPLPEIEKMTNANRKIGLGVMGFAEALIQLGISYDSEEALATAEELISFISEEAIEKSIQIALERGSFPNFKGSLWEKNGYEALRNASLITIAPTGTISIIAGCSSGIEPLFAVSFVRNVLEGTKLLETNPLFEKIAKERGFHSEALMMEIAKRESLREIEEIPDDIKRLFVTTFDISSEWHVRMQAVFQKYTDSAVSKTINLPNRASIEDVRKAYLLAYQLKCKGITVYRYGSKKDQVLYFSSVVGKEESENTPYVSAQSEYSGGCLQCSA